MDDHQMYIIRCTNYVGGEGDGWFGGSGVGNRVASEGDLSFIFNSSSILNSSHAFDKSCYLADTEIMFGIFFVYTN